MEAINRGLGSFGLVHNEFSFLYLDPEYFYHYYRDNDKKKIPGDQLRDTILYFGQHNFEGLKRGVVEHLTAYGMFSDNVKNTMDLAEKAYAGKRRRTGEPEFAHVLRILGFTAEFIHTLHLWDPKRDKRNKFQDIYIDPDFMFRKPLVDLLLMGVLLHDFIEPEKKDDGKTRVMGNVTFIGKTKSWQTLAESGADFPDREPGIWIDRFGYDNYQKPYISDSVHITDIPDAYFAHFINGLNSLDSFGFTDEAEVTGQVGRTVANLYSDLPSLLITPYYIPALIKLLDRLDNTATYTFRQMLNSSEIIPSQDSKIYEKALHTLKFSRLEEALSRFIANIPLYVLVRSVSFGKVNVGKFYPDFVAMMPSVWAKKTLLGYGINDIWVGRSAKSGKLILPRLL